ncbi:MAG: D-alanine--D-alanine ligase [Rickettsiaceae bacterium]|nr:D-alanine--D-alanine ligase [Rickettsiaceae bacterium]
MNKIIGLQKTILTEVKSKGSIHVALLIGGLSAEREVSLVSGKSLEQALIENGYRVTRVDMGNDIASVLEELKPDVVFNGLHGTFGEDGSVPAILDLLKIPYTHSGRLASAICFDKCFMKDILSANNLKSAMSIIVSKAENLSSDPIKRPYVIKPFSQGSSIGIEVVFEGDDFKFSDYKFEYGDEVLVENYIKGKELQVAVLNGVALDVLEIKLLKRRFYDYDTKYTEGFAEHILPANIPSNIYEKAKTISEKIYKIFRCRGLARVELIYCEEEHDLYILEINTHPGFTPTSICPEIAAYKGISFNELVKTLVEGAKFGD